MKNKLFKFAFLCLFFVSLNGFAREQVFTLSSTTLLSQGGIQLHWDIASNAYLYKKFIEVTPVDSNKVHVGTPVFPEGETKQTKLFGPVTIYYHTLDINVPIENMSNEANIALKVSYQGCSDQGQCFPPSSQIIQVDFPNPNPNSNISTNKDNFLSNTQTNNQAINIQEKLHDYSIIQMMALFLALGFFLALTPCILPMIPILSSIILQGHHYEAHHKTYKYRAFFLSLSYVLGISFAYGLLGYLMSSIGAHTQAIFQNPLILIIFGFIFVLLALSLFGLFELKLLHSTNHKLARITHKLANIASKNYLTVMLMGFLSALIISPCVTPPLVGVLAYIASTGNTIIGTALLFSMGFGMGIPLLIIGVLENKFLPKAGAWMEVVKLILGVMLLGMAVALWQRVVPPNTIPLLWGGFIILVALIGFYQIKLKTKFMRILFQTLCFLAVLYGALPILEHFTGFVLFADAKNQLIQKNNYVLAKNNEQLASYIEQAKKEHKPVMVDFYADWCLDCKSMEATVFNQENILNELKRFMWIKVDMSKDSQAIWDIQDAYKISGPPTFLFYSSNGEALESLGFVGIKSQKEVGNILKSVS